MFSPQGYVNYEFSDLTGRRVSVYTPTGVADTKIDYYYDELGRLAQVLVDKRNDQDVNEITSYGYNAVGSLATIQYPNGNTSTYTYNDLNRLTTLEHKNSSSATLAKYEYTLAADGKRTAAKETLMYDGSPYKSTFEWQYDNLNRLLYEKNYETDPPATIWRENTYTYDLLGNRQTWTNIDHETPPKTTSYSYSYNNLDQLTQETIDSNTISYTYDDNGSLTFKDAGSDPNITYAYNYRGRMEQVSIENGSTIDYLYNPGGIRTRTTVDGNDTDYLIDPYNHTGYAQVFKEIGDANTVYIIGHDVIAQATGTGDPNYFLYDGLGSMRQLTNSSGTVINDQAHYYNAYGNRITAWSDPPQTNLQFAGEWYDSDAMQYNLRARWYNPANGRFNRMDPLAGNNYDPQSLHKYLYAHCNPINSIDPSGMFASSVGAIGTISIGAVVQAAISKVVLTAGYVAVDTLLDKLRKKGVLWHVRDKTLIRLAKRFNHGALIAGNSSQMYFIPINFVPPIIDVVGLFNNAFFQGGIAALIRTGAWDLRTRAGIAAFVAARPQAAAGIAANPSLGNPSREPVLVISAAKDSWSASMFGGGIAVRNELGCWNPASFIFKSVVTIPGEHVGWGRYKTKPEVIE